MSFSQLPNDIQRQLLEPHITGQYAVDVNRTPSGRIPTMQQLRLWNCDPATALLLDNVQLDDNVQGIPIDARSKILEIQEHIEFLHEHIARTRRQVTYAEQHLNTRLQRCQQANIDPRSDETYLFYQRRLDFYMVQLRNRNYLLAYFQEGLSRWENYLREMQRSNRRLQPRHGRS